MQEILLPPYAPVLMESTRALGYSLESAVADLLDNSISADSTNIEIQYRPWDNPYLYILDNGGGMLPDEITAAMRERLAKHPLVKSYRRGEYGEGGDGVTIVELSEK